MLLFKFVYQKKADFCVFFLLFTARVRSRSLDQPGVFLSFSFSTSSAFYPLRGNSRDWKFVFPHILANLEGISKRLGNFYYFTKKSFFSYKNKNYLKKKKNNLLISSSYAKIWGETNFQSRELSFLNTQNFHLRGDSKIFEGLGPGQKWNFFDFPPGYLLVRYMWTL